MTNDVSIEKAATDSHRDRALKIAGFLVIALLAFVSLNGLYYPFGPPGIDNGYFWAVNQAVNSDWAFGSDIVFPYGPLGFLIYPMDVGSNLLIANSLFLAIQILFGAALAGLFSREPRLAPIVAFALLFVCARYQGLRTEGFLLLVIGLCALVAVVHNRPSFLGAASATAAMSLMVKMSLGVAAGAILVVAVLVGRLLYRRPISSGAGILVYPIVLAALAVIFFDSLASFANWVRLSGDLVSGFSVAMSLRGPVVSLVVGVAVMVGWFSAPLLIRRDRPLLACYLVFAPVVLVQFRMAFVRQDTHQLQFIPFMLAATAICLLFSRGRRQTIAHGTVFLLLLAIGAATGLVTPQDRGLLPSNLWRGWMGPAAVKSLFTLEEKRRVLASRSTERLAPLRLPDDWRALLADSRNGVGTLPWEIQYAPANDLRWNPTPTFQLYTAYTERLDNWNARRYEGDNPPQYILNEFAAVGRHRQLFDAPATWRTVFTHYRLRSVWKRNPPLLLLERRLEVPRWPYEEVGRDTIRIEGAGIEVPRSPYPLFASLDMRLNLSGRIQKSIFRVPAVFLAMEHASGQSSFCRLVPATAVNGILINAYPHDVMDYLQLWRGHIADPVVRCTITGPGSGFFKPDAMVTWHELRIGETD